MGLELMQEAPERVKHKAEVMKPKHQWDLS